MATGRKHRLTAFNVAAVAKLDLPPLREFWFTNRAGRALHSFLALPPAFDESRKYPLLVLIHGGPHLMWRDEITLRWNYHLLAQPGYVVLMTNYSGSTGYGEKFAQAIQGDPLAAPRMRSTRLRTRRSGAIRSSTRAGRPRAAQAMAVTWRTGWRYRPLAIGRS